MIYFPKNPLLLHVWCSSNGFFNLEKTYFASSFSVSAQAAYFATFSWLSVLSLPLART